jgi:hypothetical protein
MRDLHAVLMRQFPPDDRRAIAHYLAARESRQP